MAIEFCLKKVGISLQDVDIVSSPLITYDNYATRLELLFKFHFGYSPKIELYHHHLCHAASSFYLSGFRESLILTIDYSGDSSSGLVALGKGSQIEVLKYFNRDNSIGVFYSMITQFLGFEAHNDEYKVMGLASYGDAIYMDEMGEILSVKEKEPIFETSFHRRFSNPEIYTSDFTTFQEMSFNEKLTNLLGDPRRKDEPITQRHKDIAASLQKQTEIVVLKLLNEFDVETKNFCFAGGVALNCKLNHEIIKSKKFEGFFVQPAAGDAGVSLGAALLSCVKAGIESFDISSIVYLGIEYSNKEIKDYLDLCKLKFEYVANPELKAAELIAKNKIVGWFQGRSEWGPRALENRSILANPMNKYMKDLVNNNIKFREEFRPFAPAVLKESQDKYFQICFDDPYMLTLADVTDYAKKFIPAVIHSDNTARIQTVIRDKNPLFWKLIKNFGEITGEDVVLNTSLNLNGQPLCARLSEAVKAFFSSGMDYIIMGNYMLSKEGK